MHTARARLSRHRGRLLQAQLGDATKSIFAIVAVLVVHLGLLDKVLEQYVVFDPRDDFVHAFALHNVREQEGARAAHTVGVAVHDLERCAT